MVIFEAACGGDVRHRNYVEISSVELTIMKLCDFNHYRFFLLWDFEVINQDGSEISPDSWRTSVCLVDKVILKRFSHTPKNLIFSKIYDGLFKDFSNIFEFWTLIKHGNFWSSMRGDVRHRIYVEISSFELTIMKLYDFNHYRFFWLWEFAVINQDGSEISPDSWKFSVFLVEKAILKRFSHTPKF